MTEKEIAAKFSREHAALLDNMKNSLLIVLFKRLGSGDKTGLPVYVSAAEIDQAAGVGLAFELTQDQLGFNFRTLEPANMVGHEWLDDDKANRKKG